MKTVNEHQIQYHNHYIYIYQDSILSYLQGSKQANKSNTTTTISIFIRISILKAVLHGTNCMTLKFGFKFSSYKSDQIELILSFRLGESYKLFCIRSPLVNFRAPNRQSPSVNFVFLSLDHVSDSQTIKQFTPYL